MEKNLIQLGTFSIPNPDGGVKGNYLRIAGGILPKLAVCRAVYNMVV